MSTNPEDMERDIAELRQNLEALQFECERLKATDLTNFATLQACHDILCTNEESHSLLPTKIVMLRVRLAQAEAGIAARDEYIKLLEQAERHAAGAAMVHGYVTPDDLVAKGQELRNRIADSNPR